MNTTIDGAPLISKALALSLVGTLLGLLLVWTFGGIWWASGISSDVGTIKQTQQIMRTENYSRTEANLQIQRLDGMDGRLQAQIAVIEADHKQMMLLIEKFKK